MMEKLSERRSAAWGRIRVRVGSHRARLRNFIKNPIIDLRFKLLAMSLASPAIAFSGGVFASYGLLQAKYAFVFYITGAMLGMLVLATMAARFLDLHFSEFKAAKMFGVGVVALASYAAHGIAVGEVNAIFEIDASSLPHATAAASVMVLATLICDVVLVPILIVSSISFLYFAWIARAGNVMISAAIWLASLLWIALIASQAAPGENRRSNLYQIALAMDFNKRSHCVGLPADSEGVVFIGSGQRRAIVAPQLVEIRRSTKSIFRSVEVPSDFDIVDCN